MTRKLTIDDLRQAAERLKNWGRWGDSDEIGTLNHIEPADVVGAAQLVRKGRVMSLALPFDSSGPQGAKTNYPPLGRFNPIRLMVRTGTDAYSGVLDARRIRTAEDILIMPTQSGTQWDGLSHVFYGDNMWNGYDCRNVSSFGAARCGIEKTKDKMVGRGVLLDIARMLDMPYLPAGFAITGELLDRASGHFQIEVRRGDFLIVRTGNMEEKLAAGSWDGYPGGDAPGLSFETLDWLQEKRVAAVATDTFAVEVRPNEIEDVVSPFHWIAIPILGLTLGEMFYVAELAADCAEDGRYEFMFVAPTLPITGAVGSPTNPLAIK